MKICHMNINYFRNKNHNADKRYLTNHSIPRQDTEHPRNRVFSDLSRHLARRTDTSSVNHRDRSDRQATSVRNNRRTCFSTLLNVADESNRLNYRDRERFPSILNYESPLRCRHYREWRLGFSSTLRNIEQCVSLSV